MELTIAALVLLSAVLHPMWNALIKHDPRPEGAYLGLVIMLITLAASHALAAGYDLRAIVEVWPLLLLSWAGQMLYGTSLVVTLKRGDLSAYYPIVRSSPLFIVAVGLVFLDQHYSAALLAGVALALIGAFALQYRPGVRLLDDPVTLAFAIAAMSGTGIYSIADSRAMQVIEPPVLFFWVEVGCLPSFILLFRLTGVSTLGWRGLIYWTGRPFRFIGLGLMCYTSYVLILTAYEMGGDVAAVTSVRQASIPLSVLIGGLWLKEQATGRRLGASLVLASGIVVIVLTG